MCVGSATKAIQPRMRVRQPEVVLNSINKAAEEFNAQLLSKQYVAGSDNLL